MITTLIEPLNSRMRSQIYWLRCPPDEASATAIVACFEKLFVHTADMLGRKESIALDYFRSASKIARSKDESRLEQWTVLCRRVAESPNGGRSPLWERSPRTIEDLIARQDPQSLGEVLRIANRIAAVNPALAVECFLASPKVLDRASVTGLVDWSLRGLKLLADNEEQAQAYFALHSKQSEQALEQTGSVVMLNSVEPFVRLYIEGLTGREVTLVPMEKVYDLIELGDGETICLPDRMDRSPDRQINFRLYKVLAARAAGQLEFGTYECDTTDLHRVREELRQVFPWRSSLAQNGAVSAKTLLNFFPDRTLAQRLFTLLENGRIEQRLRQKYSGLRRDLDLARDLLTDYRPPDQYLLKHEATLKMIHRIVLGKDQPEVGDELEFGTVVVVRRALEQTILPPNATVAKTLRATLAIYQRLNPEPPENSVPWQDERGEEQPDIEPKGTQPSPEPASRNPSPPRSDRTNDQEQELDRVDDFDQAGAPGEAAFRFSVASSDGNGGSLQPSPGETAFYYDEWDYRINDYRPRWCRVVERECMKGDTGYISQVRAQYAGVLSSVRHQFQMMRPAGLRRVSGQVHGDELDWSAVVDYLVDRRVVPSPSDRVYSQRLRHERDVAVCFLLDMSSSTSHTVGGAQMHRIIEVEKQALVLMAEALEAVGDPYAIYGFSSHGRARVSFYLVKAFDEAYSVEVQRRVAGIRYLVNTRLGAAIRHATARLAAQPHATRLLILLSDGQPFDDDYGNQRYARADTQMALREAKMRGVTPFCITIDSQSEPELREIYGEVGYTIVDDVLSLPERIVGIYRRLTT